MTRVPNSGLAERERLQHIRRLQASLRRFERVPPHRREAECADEGERDCKALLADLGAPGYERRETSAGNATLTTIDEYLAEVERDQGQIT